MSAGEDLIRVLGQNRSTARSLQYTLEDIASAHDRLGQHSLANELRIIGESIVGAAEHVWRAHGEALAEDGQRTADGISGVFNAIFSTARQETRRGE